MASLNKIIVFYGIGSGSDPSRRFVQFVTPQRGWAGFVTDYITPMINRGFRRFLLWMPHGQEATTRMQLIGNTWLPTRLRHDAWRVAQRNSAYDWFTTGFAEAFLPITNSGIEIIAYVGTLHGAPEYDAMPTSQAKYEAAMAIAPILDARCSVGLDTSVRSQPGHYVYELAQVLKGCGYKYYIEPTPYVDGQHWYSSSCVVSDEQWTNVINPFNHSLLAAPNLLTGEIIRGWFSSPPSQYANVRDWYRATVPAALAQGHTVCLPLTLYFTMGGTVPELVLG